MSDINGYDNEYEFVKYLNGKKVCELNPMFRDFIDSIFYFIDEESVIKSWRNHYPQKSDIFIKIGRIIKGVSIKKGMKNSVHVDRITDFIHFLIENNVDREIVIEYLKYHYADGSTNGKGSKRLSAEEYKINNQASIDKINQVFNNRELLNKAIERFIIKGNNSKYYIDAIIHGEVDDFIWLTRSEIVDVILSKKDMYSSAIHFGPITCQPKNRCLNYNPKYEKDRFCVQLKWYNLNDDIIEYKNDEVIKNRIIGEQIEEFLNS